MRLSIGQGPLTLGLAGVAMLAVGCQLLTGISDYETVDGLGGGGAASTSTTSSGPGAGGQGGTGGTIVDPPVVVWRYAGVSGSGSFSRGLGLGIGSMTGSPMVVGAIRGANASLDGITGTDPRTRNISFEVVDETNVINADFGVPLMGVQQAAYTTAAQTGTSARGGLYKNTIGQTALSFDGPLINESQLALVDDVSPEDLGTSLIRSVGVHAFSNTDVLLAGNFTGDITVGTGMEGFLGTGLHALMVRTDPAMMNPSWQVQFRVGNATGGDIWIEDFAFDNSGAVVVGRYSGANTFQIASTEGPTFDLDATNDSGLETTDVFYAEIATNGTFGERRSIVRTGNQAFTEVERRGDALFIGGHYSGELAFGATNAATSNEERGFVARLGAMDLGGAKVVQFAGTNARVSAMTANSESLYVSVDCSGSIDVLIDDAVAYTTNGANDDLCFFGFDMASSPPSITTAARFDGDQVSAEDMIFDSGDVFITGTYSGIWNLPGQDRVSNDDALFVLRLTPPN